MPYRTPLNLHYPCRRASHGKPPPNRCPSVRTIGAQFTGAEQVTGRCTLQSNWFILPSVVMSAPEWVSGASPIQSPQCDTGPANGENERIGWTQAATAGAEPPPFWGRHYLITTYYVNPNDRTDKVLQTGLLHSKADRSFPSRRNNALTESYADSRFCRFSLGSEPL